MVDIELSAEVCKRTAFVKQLIQTRYNHKLESLEHFAPSNIALNKYWGKRDHILFLPENSSLSLSLGCKGAKTKLRIIKDQKDRIILNNTPQAIDSRFSKPIVSFLDLFRDYISPSIGSSFLVETTININHSSGLASSACGFAALTKCLNDVFCWDLNLCELSKIARLGSGSASRSLFNGFVIWHRGQCPNGSDSYAQKVDITWPELTWGILKSTDKIKTISSRKAMLESKATSPLYEYWPDLSQSHFEKVLDSIMRKDFQELGGVMEQNCELMHSVIQSSRPSIFFRNSQSLSLIERVISLRKNGVDIYYTQDAGHHIKVLFEYHNLEKVKSYFKDNIEIVRPFEQSS